LLATTHDPEKTLPAPGAAYLKFLHHKMAGWGPVFPQPSKSKVFAEEIMRKQPAKAQWQFVPALWRAESIGE
jgi:hypothetical protein